MILSSISLVNGSPEFRRRAFVIAAGAFMHAPRDKQGAACTGAVDDVDGVILMEVHLITNFASDVINTTLCLGMNITCMPLTISNSEVM